MIVKVVDLDLLNPSVVPIIYVPRYDGVLRRLQFRLFAESVEYEIPLGTSVTVRGTKPDRNGFTYNYTYNKNVVTGYCTEQMSAVVGDVICQIVMVDTNNDRLASFIFILRVEDSSTTEATVYSESEIALTEQVINDLQGIHAYSVMLEQLQKNKLEFKNYDLETIFLES